MKGTSTKPRGEALALLKEAGRGAPRHRERTATATDAKSSCIHEFAFVFFVGELELSPRETSFFFFVRSRQILQRPYNTGILQARSARPSRASFLFQSQRPEDEAPRRRHESEPAPCRQNQAEPEVKPASGEDEESGSGGGNHGRRGRYQPSRGRVRRREGE